MDEPHTAASDPGLAPRAGLAPQRVLVYCQSLVGVGHLTSTLRIIEALLPHVEVDLIHGGLEVAMPPARPGWRSLRLPTLLHDEDSGEFFSPDAGGPSLSDSGLAAIWAARARAMAGFLRMPYQAVLLEFYPFGRRRFKAEIMGMLGAVKAACGPVPVFTSVREVLVPRARENEQRMVDSVNKQIHTVFVRSDPAVIRLHDTFSLAPLIADRLCHTGYISPPLPAVRPPRRAQVLVSQGGGDVGRELLAAAIGAAARMPQMHFLLACGSRTPDGEIAALRQSARSGNVEIVPFLNDFTQQLMASAVSISMGGDNTLLDVLATRTPALAYPYQGNSEQGFRVRRFADQGLLHELQADDLVPERLQARIEAALRTPLPPRPVAMDGAQVTSAHIRAAMTGAGAGTGAGAVAGASAGASANAGGP